MKYGFDENEYFYMDYDTCRYQPGNMREESDRRALEIANMYSNLWVSNSGGVDSQSMIISLQKHGVPFESVFMYHPGYNEREIEQVRELDKKFGIKTHVIDIDPNSFKEELIKEAAENKVHLNSILVKKFVLELPSDVNLIMMSHDPYVHINADLKALWTCGYHSPEVNHDRILKNLDREGTVIFYGDTSEMLYSILTDDCFQGCVNAWQYFRDNKLDKPGVSLQTVDRWDYYIKPIIYGKYWTRDEMTFYTKYQGFRQIEWLNISGIDCGADYFAYAVMHPLDKFIAFLNSGPGKTKRFYQNISNRKYFDHYKKTELIKS